MLEIIATFLLSQSAVLEEWISGVRTENVDRRNMDRRDVEKDEK